MNLPLKKGSRTRVQLNMKKIGWMFNILIFPIGFVIGMTTAILLSRGNKVQEFEVIFNQATTGLLTALEQLHRTDQEIDSIVQLESNLAILAIAMEKYESVEGVQKNIFEIIEYKRQYPKAFERLEREIFDSLEGLIINNTKFINEFLILDKKQDEMVLKRLSTLLHSNQVAKYFKVKSKNSSNRFILTNPNDNILIGIREIGRKNTNISIDEYEKIDPFLAKSKSYSDRNLRVISIGDERLKLLHCENGKGGAYFSSVVKSGDSTLLIQVFLYDFQSDRAVEYYKLLLQFRL